jgi:hypothetical protein
MNVSLKSPMTLGLILAISLLAVPARGAPAPKTMQEPAHHQMANLAKAQAFVGPATPVLRGEETDGLGRNDEECNMGCVDH